MIHTVGHLSESKYRKKYIIVCAIIFFVFIFSSCGKSEDSNGANDNFQLESALKVLGADETEIPKSFTVDDTDEIADIVYDDVPVKIKLEFENGKLLRIQYNFGTNTDTAFKFVNEVQKEFEQKWGKSDTYETLPDRIKGLTVENYLSSDIMQYKEYWIDTDIDFAGIVPKKYESSKRVDLGIGINKIPVEETITVVYIGGIVNSTNTTKLSD